MHSAFCGSFILSLALASGACHSSSGSNPVEPTQSNGQAPLTLASANAPVLASVPVPGAAPIPVPVPVPVPVAGPTRVPSGLPRRPRGIYAVVALDETPGAAPPDLPALLGNPAVSGLTVRVFWSTLQPARDRYDWSKLEEAFAAASATNKTVQLIILPGFGTPHWVMDELPTCDPYLSSQGPGGPCGKATFEVSEGVFHGQPRELPLPWNATYKGYWRAFLRDLAAKYGPRDAFVSIAIAGPTAMSAEILLPRAGDQLERWGRLLQLSYRDPSYHRSNKAILEEWESAFDTFGQIFSNVTLVATRGSGLLAFTRGAGLAAHAALLANFATHPVGSNAKATQTSGMKACRATQQGILGVKEFAADGSLSPRVLGGAQFDTSFSRFPAKEGCADCDATAGACVSLTPDEALANVLAKFFDGTPAGDAFGASRGPAPMSYMQVYAEDIRYASGHPTAEAKLMEASRRILAMAN
jgi:hypothetical protein